MKAFLLDDSWETDKGKIKGKKIYLSQNDLDTPYRHMDISKITRVTIPEVFTGLINGKYGNISTGIALTYYDEASNSLVNLNIDGYSVDTKEGEEYDIWILDSGSDYEFVREWLHKKYRDKNMTIKPVKGEEIINELVKSIGRAVKIRNILNDENVNMVLYVIKVGDNKIIIDLICNEILDYIKYV